MTTNKQLYYQLKLLILNTRKQLSITHWDDRYMLAGHNNGTGETRLSRNLSKTEIYETLYTINQLFESMQTKDQFIKVADLSEKAFSYVTRNLHNDSVPQVMEIIE